MAQQCLNASCRRTLFVMELLLAMPKRARVLCDDARPAPAWPLLCCMKVRLHASGHIFTMAGVAREREEERAAVAAALTARLHKAETAARGAAVQPSFHASTAVNDACASSLSCAFRRYASFPCGCSPALMAPRELAYRSLQCLRRLPAWWPHALLRRENAVQKLGHQAQSCQHRRPLR